MPGIIGVTVLFAYEYRLGRAQLERDTTQTARALLQAVDSQILRIQTLAQGIATASSLYRGDFGTFHERARKALAQTSPNSTAILADRTGKQILNTAEDFGRPLPIDGDRETIARVFQTGKPTVSNLFVSTLPRRPLVGVAVPVLLDGRVAYVLIITVPPDEFNRLLDAQGLPPGWVATILDGAATIVARSRESERFTGQKPAAAILERFLASSEGILEAVMKDGVSVVSAFSRSPTTSWRVAISIPQQTLTAQLTRRLSILAAGIAGLFAIGLGLAWLLGRKLARSFQTLIAPASALGSGQAVSLPRPEVEEAAAVTQALGEAYRLLERRAEALRQAHQILSASEEKYRTLFANMAEGFGLGEPILDAKGAAVDIRYLEVNAAYYDQSGLAQAIEGRPMREILPQLEQFWIDRLATVALTGQAQRFADHNADTGRYYDVYAFSPSPGRFATLFRDITEQKRMERALQESENNLRELIAALPGMVWTGTREGTVDFLSQQWLDYTGTVLASQLGTGFLDPVHPDDREPLARLWQQTIAEQRPFRVEFRLRGGDGRYRWFVSRGTPIRGSDGDVSRWLGIITDIDDLKLTQEALQEVEQRYRSLFNNKTSAIAHHRVIADAQGEPVDYSIESINDTYAQILGVTRSQVEGHRVTEIFPGIRNLPFDVVGEFGRIGLEGGEGSFEIYFPPGRQWLSVYAYSPKSGEFTAIFTDITAQKRAEEALRQERSRLQAIIDNSPLLILVKDLEGRVVLANQAIFEKIKVPPRERFIGHSLFESFPPDVAEARWMKDMAAMESDAPIRTEETIRHVDGTWHTYVTVRFPVHDIETQALIGICAISTDISERKAAEAAVHRLNSELEDRVVERTTALERSNEALLHSNTELKHFAHATAHDLKTPLRSIVGFAQILHQEVQGRGDMELADLSSRVIDNTKRLQTLIDDLLAYTRLDALGLPFDPTNLQDVAEEVLASLQVLIQETGAEVCCGRLPILPVDRIQIAQVLQNLIENGIKYNRSQPPKVSVSCDFQDDEWIFSVIDNGIGIDPKHHERIFEIFRRLHPYHQIAGTGIGLALCRRAVERHGGRIWVQSQPGKGSTFYFTLPVRDDAAP